MKKNKTQDLSYKERIKPIFKQRFLEMLSNDENEYEKFEETILKPQKKSFRINTLKEENPEDLIKNIKNKGLKLEQIPWTPLGYFVEYDENTRHDLGNLFEHFLGKIYVQEATSMLPPITLEIPENIDNNFTVLDMCAAPGSKTTQLADIMNNRGKLIANEIDYKRLGPLKINLERSGFTNIIITQKNGTNIKGENLFDRILLDAPCSGSGVIRKSPKTLDKYNPKKLKSLNNTQLELLNTALRLLKSGGIMTYSTCSLDPEENEILVKKFLEKNNNAQILPIEIEGVKKSNLIKNFQGEEIPKQVYENTLRVWPQDNDTNGFFIAKIKKL